MRRLYILFFCLLLVGSIVKSSFSEERKGSTIDGHIWTTRPEVMKSSFIFGFLWGNRQAALAATLSPKDYAFKEFAIAEGADPNMKILGKPLFHQGVYDIFYLKTLLDNGVDINIKSSYGRTALHEAALHGKVEIVKFLLENDADVNAKNNRGETPLFYAEGGIIAGPKMTENHKKVAELLKKYGGIKLGRRPFSRR